MNLAEMRTFLAIVAMSTWTGLGVISAGGASTNLAPPQMQLKAYPIQGKVNAADISPDETLVAAETSVKKQNASGVDETAEAIQVWDFKANKLLAESVLKQWPGPTKQATHPPGFILEPRIVRFSSDGTKIVALLGDMIFVLQSPGLTLLRQIPVADPARDEPLVKAMELSPHGDSLAVLWAKNPTLGNIEIYSLLSGEQLARFDVPTGWVQFTNSLAWDQNGERLVLSIPSVTPCESPDNEPDLFVFDVRTRSLTRSFRSGLLPGSIGVAQDNRLLVVDSNCLGVFKHHDPPLKVFDVLTGKLVHTIEGRGSGVRYTVSVSTDGSRFVAFTGKMKTKFDWSDAVPYGVAEDETFSVWNAKDYSGIVTSQNIPGITRSTLRLSAHGHYVLALGNPPSVYELPQGRVH